MIKCSVPQCGRFTDEFLAVPSIKYENWFVCFRCMAEGFGVPVKKRIDNIRVGSQFLEEFIKKEK